MCSVRGIGVAVSASTSTSSRSDLSSSFCATPKRCSSSTIDEPEVLRDHVAGEDAVRADQHVDLALGEVGEDPLRPPSAARKRETISTRTGKSR